MRRVAWAALFVLACTGNRAAETSAIIPLEEEQGHFWIQGSIGDSAPMLIGVDTGAGVTVIDRQAAEKLGLRQSRSGRLGGAGGTVESDVIHDVDLRLPGVELRNLTLRVIDLAPVNARGGHPMAMILGYDMFSRFVAEIDYDARELRLHDPDTYVAPSSMTVVPIEIRQNHPHVEATAIVGGGRETGLFVIDSGSSNSVIFMPDVLRSRKLLERVPKTLTSRGGGVGGEFAVHLGRIDALTFAGFTIPRPIALFPDRGEFAAPGSIGNLGGQILRRFRVVFDYPHSRMFLAPSRKFDEPDESDMTGALLVLEDGARVRVVRVRDEGPGAEAGLRAGDELVAVDGTPAVELGLSAIRARFRTPGVEYRLRIRRGEGELEVSLRTRRLI